MFNIDGYPLVISSLSDAEGSGFKASFPDFNVCYGIGKTADEAVAEARSALFATIEAYKHWGDPVPAPNSHGLGAN